MGSTLTKFIQAAEVDMKIFQKKANKIKNSKISKKLSKESKMVLIDENKLKKQPFKHVKLPPIKKEQKE